MKSLIAVDIHAADRVDAIRAVYRQIDYAQMKLSSANVYISDFVGGTGGIKSPKASSGNGKPIVGIVGKNTGNICRLGLVISSIDKGK
jgi:hypothetical protein